MRVGKHLVSFSVGLLIAVIAIGILPFLVVYSWSELYGMPDFYEIPHLPIIRKFFK